MKGDGNFATRLQVWAEQDSRVEGLVLIGSRTRDDHDAIWRADSQSDWDFQIITSQPELFRDRSWAGAIPGAELRIYAVREARLVDVPKVAAIFSDAEVDFVVVPVNWLEQLRRGLDAAPSPEAQVLRDLRALAVVIRPGWRFLKGAAAWEPFYRRIVAEVADPRLDNATAGRLADGFVCDLIWARRKLDRGELIAAQRMIHRELAEVNFRLLHELRLRRGERSFPDGRRIERIASPAELKSISVSASLTATELSAALEQSAMTLRDLMQELVGVSWRWPNV